MTQRLDMDDRMLARSGPLGERIVAVPVAPDIADGSYVAERLASIDLAEYLGRVEGFLVRYVAFPSAHEAVAVALWIAAAHLVELFETSPLLAITSAEMRSGKTRLLELLELLVPHPFRVIMPSEAVVYTVLAQRPRRTMLLDEADAVFSPRMAERYEGLRAILNAGNRQGNPVLRVKLEGRRREVESFDVFGPKVIAGIGNLPTTVADRSIPVRMKRRAPTEMVARFRERIARGEAAAIRFPSLDVTLVTDVTIPDALNDRAADSWEPLVAIAELASGEWPERARLAAVALSGEDEVEFSTGMRLLADIRDGFDSQAVDHLSTADLLTYLQDLEESPWGDWYGKPLTPRGLARLLDPYRVSPILRRVEGTRRRGYFRSEFEDAWTRYLPVLAPVTSVPTVTPSLWEESESLPADPDTVLPGPDRTANHMAPTLTPARSEHGEPPNTAIRTANERQDDR